MTRRRRIGDLIELQRRWIEVDPLETYQEIGVRSFGRGIFHKEPVTGDILGNKRVLWIEPGDLVFNNVFAWEGAVGLAAEAERGKSGSHRFMTYVPKSDDVDVRYLYYFFRCEEGVGLLGLASPGSAGRNRTLAIDRFEALEIPLPPIDEQRRIATRLGHISRVAESVEQRLQRAAMLARSVLPSMARASDRVVELGELVRRVSRPEFVDAERVYRLLGVRWYGEGLFVRERKDGRDLSAAKVFRVEAGDLVYNRLFAWKGSFAIADPSVAGSYVSNEFPTFEIDVAAVEPAYLISVLRDPRVWDEALEGSSGSTPTSRNRLKEERFLELKIPLPGPDDQIRVGTIAGVLGVIATSRAEQRARLAAMVPAVLNRAFAGLA